MNNIYSKLLEIEQSLYYQAIQNMDLDEVYVTQRKLEDVNKLFTEEMWEKIYAINRSNRET